MKQLIIIIIGVLLMSCVCGEYPDECLNGRCLGDEVRIKGTNITGYIDGFRDRYGNHNDSYKVKYRLETYSNFYSDWFKNHELIFSNPAREETKSLDGNKSTMKFKEH